LRGKGAALGAKIDVARLGCSPFWKVIDHGGSTSRRIRGNRYHDRRFLSFRLLKRSEGKLRD
jgi:hypothetical protein